jgi:uncharacterized iron-regulated membrane protein
MGHPDGAHTHGGGGSGLGEVVLYLIAAVLLGPAVIGAALALLHALIIAAAICLGVAIPALTGFIVWQLRRRREPPWAVHQVTPAPPRPAQALPAPRRQAIEAPRQLHLHFHGVGAEDVAAIIRQQQEDQ